MGDDKRFVEFELDHDHPETQAFAMWVAFGESLKMLARDRGNDGWHRELYEQIHDKLSLGQFTDSSGAPKEKSSNPDLDAHARSALEIVEAAFSRLR